MRTTHLNEPTPSLHSMLSISQEIQEELRALTPQSAQAIGWNTDDASLPSFGLGMQECYEVLDVLEDADEYDYEGYDVYERNSDDTYENRHSPLDDDYYCQQGSSLEATSRGQDSYLWPEMDSESRPLSLELRVTSNLEDALWHSITEGFEAWVQRDVTGRPVALLMVHEEARGCLIPLDSDVLS